MHFCSSMIYSAMLEEYDQYAASCFMHFHYHLMFIHLDFAQKSMTFPFLPPTKQHETPS